MYSSLFTSLLLLNSTSFPKKDGCMWTVTGSESNSRWTHMLWWIEFALNLNIMWQQLPGKAESRHLPGNDRLKTKIFGELTSPKDWDLNIHLGLRMISMSDHVMSQFRVPFGVLSTLGVVARGAFHQMPSWLNGIPLCAMIRQEMWGWNARIRALDIFRRRINCSNIYFWLLLSCNCTPCLVPTMPSNGNPMPLGKKWLTGLWTMSLLQSVALQSSIHSTNPLWRSCGHRFKRNSSVTLWNIHQLWQNGTTQRGGNFSTSSVRGFATCQSQRSLVHQENPNCLHSTI